ncbi:MAG: cytochrome b5 domain-containing protein [Candidatus Daviesbacteria bacterium]|nr:cytochrome b5 domain-containing protein [Candidatus Daviesbacteria bacterium]
MLKKIIIILAILGILISIYLGSIYLRPRQDSAPQGLPSYTASDLLNFNGVDPSKPILLALDGLVYDVTPGKEFYEVGGDYHDLAGKDSSALLHIAGGDIIKRKYKVIGIYKI